MATPPPTIPPRQPLRPKSQTPPSTVSSPDEPTIAPTRSSERFERLCNPADSHGNETVEHRCSCGEPLTADHKLADSSVERGIKEFFTKRFGAALGALEARLERIRERGSGSGSEAFEMPALPTLIRTISPRGGEDARPRKEQRDDKRLRVIMLICWPVLSCYLPSMIWHAWYGENRLGLSYGWKVALTVLGALATPAGFVLHIVGFWWRPWEDSPGKRVHGSAA